MDGPPTSRMYSPDAGDAACAPKANIDKKQTSKRRFIIISERTIYAGRQITQVVAAIADRSRPASTMPATVLNLIAHQIFPCLPFSNQRKFIATNQRFTGQRARVIIGRHHKAVRASAHDGEQIAFMEFWHFPIQRKEI